MRTKENLPQIPWAKEAKVIAADIDFRGETVVLVLENDYLTVDVDGGGGISTILNSRKNIHSSLTLSEEFTESLRTYLTRNEVSFDYASGWLGNQKVIPKSHAMLFWYPDEENSFLGKKIKFGRSQAREDWIGSDFDYLWFQFPGGEGGLAIDWEQRGEAKDVEVWTGPIEWFFSDNTDDEDNYASYNRTLENGILWAMDQLGVFEGDEIPRWVVRMLHDEPDLFWHDLAVKLVGRSGEIPKELYIEAGKWLDGERRAWEQEAGQIYLWPQENDNG